MALTLTDDTALMALRGYTPLGGKSRRFRAPNGDTISRREYDNRRAQDAGFRNRYHLEQFRTDVIARTRWQNWAYDVKQHTGRAPTWEMYGDVREVRFRRARLRRRYPHLEGPDLDSHDRELVASDGPLARILDASGRRPINGRPVGDS